MQYRKLGTTDIDVSVICLGTMTWGEQNTRVEAFRQMDYALAQGVNFFDTAELYPIPPRAQTCGHTEEIIGNWLRKTGNRGRVVLASKIAGPGAGWIDHIRNGRTRYQHKAAAELSRKERKALKKIYRKESVKRSALIRIAAAWLITVPVSGLLAAIIYFAIRGMMLP